MLSSFKSVIIFRWKSKIGRIIKNAWKPFVEWPTLSLVRSLLPKESLNNVHFRYVYEPIYVDLVFSEVPGRNLVNIQHPYLWGFLLRFPSGRMDLTGSWPPGCLSAALISCNSSGMTRCLSALALVISNATKSQWASDIAIDLFFSNGICPLCF